MSQNKMLASKRDGFITFLKIYYNLPLLEIEGKWIEEIKRKNTRIKNKENRNKKIKPKKEKGERG